MASIWIATREKENSDICIKCRLGPDCAVRAGYSEMALYDPIRVFASELAVNRKKYIKTESVASDQPAQRHFTQMSECPFSRVASHIMKGLCLRGNFLGRLFFYNLI